MKLYKSLLLILVLCGCFFASCGSGSDTDAQVNEDGQSAAIEQMEALEQEAERVAAELNAELEAYNERQARLVGYWHGITGYPIEFTAEGDYISYPSGKELRETYEIAEDDVLYITSDSGVRTEQIELTDDELVFENHIYHRAAPIALSQEVLAGEWHEGENVTIFNDDSTYTEKATYTGFKVDMTVAFTITGFNTIDVPTQNGAQWAFLSETDLQYQLILSKTDNGVRHTTYLTKNK